MPTGNKSPQVLLKAVEDFLARKMESGDKLIEKVSNPVTYFSASCKCKIPIDSYLDNLISKVDTSPGVLVVTLVYMDRLLQAIQQQYFEDGGLDTVLLTSYNAHRVLFVSFLLAHKYCGDGRFCMEWMAKQGLMKKTEAKALEHEFLSFVDYNLFVSESTFDDYTSSLYTYSGGGEEDPIP